MTLTNLLILAQEHLLLTLEECLEEDHLRVCRLYLDAVDSPEFVDARGNRWIVTTTGIESLDD